MPKNSKTRKSVYGGAAYSYDPAPVDYFDSKTAELNLGQGRQFSQMNAARHGGSLGLLSASYPTSLGQTLPQDLMDSARLLPLQKAFDEIKGLQDGGRRRSRKNRKVSRKNRKASRKNRKSSRKNRKVSRKNRKASRKNRMNRRSTRKNRKASRKNRKSSRKNRKASRKNRKGGSLGFQEVNAPGMLLTPAQYAKAGLNPEWELAKDPNAFAPLASRN